MLRSVVLLALLLLLGACPDSSNLKYPEPKAEELLAAVTAINQRVTSFKSESLMEYWVNNERVKGKVLMMGSVGSKVRINALSPTGDNVAVDLACDGLTFQYVNMTKSCKLTGPCNRSSVAQLLRVDLAPDELLLMSAGGVALIPYQQISTNRNGDKGWDELILKSPYFTEKIFLFKHKDGWQILGAELRVTEKENNTKPLWTLANKSFSCSKVDGKCISVPGRSRFSQPDAELTVRWESRVFNQIHAPEKFVIPNVENLPLCGQ